MSETSHARGTRTPNGLAVGVALALALLGVAGTAAWLQSASDGTSVPFGWSWWRTDGVAVELHTPSLLRPGDVVVGVDGRRLADGVGTLPGSLARPGGTLRYELLRGGRPTDVDVRLARPTVGWLVPPPPAGELVWTVLGTILALYLYARRPMAPATPSIVVAAGASCGAVTVALAGLPVVDIATASPWFWVNQASMIGGTSVAWGALLALSLVPLRAAWPEHMGRLRLAAHAAPAAVVAAWTAAALAVAPSRLEWIGLIHLGQSAVGVASCLLAGLLVAVAYRRQTASPARRRFHWIAGGGAVSTGLALAGWLGPEMLLGNQWFSTGITGLAGLPLVAGVLVAIRRHRLFDIQQLLSRSVVYTVLLVGLTGAYLACVVGVGLLAFPLGMVASGCATGAAALALLPLRRGAARRARRRLFGDREDCTTALARLGQRMAAVPMPDHVLPSIVDAVAAALRLPYAAMELADGAGGFRVAEHRGTPVGAVYVQTLRSHGQTVGRLVVSAREADEPLSRSDLDVLEELSGQIGVAVHGVLLQEDLRRSRAELVATREDERLRLRRDLHDGLGPTLLGLALKADLVRVMIDPDHREPATAASHLAGEVTSTLRAAAGDLRRLVDGLRPPALDELGLTGAVRARAGAFAGGPVVRVTGPSRDEHLPAAVEVAAFHIAAEALTNAVRHSGARHCDVRIVIEDGLRLEVADDGRGLPACPAEGVGLRSMRDRARELGGSCRVVARPDGGTIVEAILPVGRS